MLPFRKNKDEGAGNSTMGRIEREHDEGFDMLASIADDLISAIEKKDKSLLRGALEALCEHIQDLDYDQDQEIKGE